METLTPKNQSTPKGQATMSPEAQRIAIAEACGWKDCGLHPNPLDGENNWMSGFVPSHTPLLRQSIPDYLNDLNAMHEAEKVMDVKGQRLSYRYRLREVVDDGFSDEWNYVHATAAQRAEAFLRTIGKWDEK